MLTTRSARVCVQVSLGLVVQSEAVDESALRESFAATLAGVSAEDIEITYHRLERIRRLQQPRRHLQSSGGAAAGVAGGGWSVTITIHLSSQFVADQAVATVTQLEATGTLSQALGVPAVVSEQPSVTLQLYRAPSPPPLPPTRPETSWKQKFGVSPGALLISGRDGVATTAAVGRVGNRTKSFVIVVDSIFRDEDGAERGGAMAVLEDGVATLTNVLFEGNVAK